mmetsp:Transcript_48850/g.116313  ORF Transcript_48850/g.116313 Transcript_48850/m.116313 type:complete len:214 (-) Transcript_48850:258-899(-)
MAAASSTRATSALFTVAPSISMRSVREPSRCSVASTLTMGLSAAAISASTRFLTTARIFTIIDSSASRGPPAEYVASWSFSSTSDASRASNAPFSSSSRHASSSAAGPATAAAITYSSTFRARAIRSRSTMSRSTSSASSSVCSSRSPCVCAARRYIALLYASSSSSASAASISISTGRSPLGVTNIRAGTPIFSIASTTFRTFSSIFPGIGS